jgi:hypothetical protein
MRTVGYAHPTEEAAMSAGEATIPDPDPERTSTETTSPSDEAKRFQRDDPAAATILPPHRQRHRLHTPESWALALVDYMLDKFQADDTTEDGLGHGGLELWLYRLPDGTLRLWLRRESDGSDLGPRLTIQPKP